MKKYWIIIMGLILAAGGHAQIYREMMQSADEHNFYEIKAAAEAHFAEVGTGKGTGYNQYMRWEMFMEPRVYPSGQIVNWAQKSIDAYKEYVESDYFQSLPSEKSHNGYWTERGPVNWNFQQGNGPGNGRINVMAFHPTNSAIMYAGSPVGGLWRTTDGGFNWTPLTDGMPNLGVSGIAINPLNANIIYILTGDGDGANAPCTGVLKTTDGGITWKQTGFIITDTNGGAQSQISLQSYNVRGYKLIINPSNPNILFAATTHGIRRTTNGGTTWTTVSTGSFRDIAFRPGVTNTIYATSTGGFSRSTDGGDTWTTISSGLPGSDWTRIAIGVSAENNNIVYLLYGGGSTGFRGLYRSANAGTSFSLRSNSPNVFSGDQSGSGTGHQAWYDIAITVSPTNSNFVAVGGINIWSSANGGDSWIIRTDWNYGNAGTGKYCHADQHFLGFNGTTLWAGNDGGVFRSLNNGLTWANRSNGLGIMQFYKICTDDTYLYGGTQDNGTNRLSLTNNTATHILGADGFECIPTATYLFASTQGGIHRRSTGSTGSWTDITPSAVANGDAPWNVAWILRPGTATTLFYGGVSGSIYRSTTSGASFSNIGGSLGNRIFNMAIGASNTTRLYAATLGNIRRSDNCTATTPTYTTISSGLPSVAITGIAVDPNNSNFVFVCLSGYSSGQKVYQSTTAGATWTNITGTLPNVPVNCILHDGTAGGLYIGTDLGVFYRNNSTGGWLPFMNGLPTTIITELEIRGNYIYAGTHGRGMWSSTLFAGCSPTLTLTPTNDPSNPASTGYQYYSASETITSTRLITGGLGTDVTYRAGNSVTMNTGFEVRSDNEFFAQTGGCNSIFQPIIPPSQGILEVFASSNDVLSTDGTSGNAMMPVSYDALLRMPTRAYPNPFGASFNIEVAAFDYDRTISGELYDLSGKKVKAISQHVVPQGQRLVLEVYADDLPAGVYVLRVLENETTETFKIVKQ